MRSKPWATGLLVLTITAGAVIFHVLLRRQAWCRYLCPLGAMVGVELVEDPERKTPAPGSTDFVLRRAAERGVLVLRAGVYRNVIRILAPLVIGEEDLGRSLAILADCLREAEALPGT
ncbi:MAG: 4Fe-4S binding protein, partial [bacterium]